MGHASSVLARFRLESQTFVTPLSLNIIEKCADAMVAQNILKRVEKLSYGNGNRLEIELLRLVPLFEAGSNYVKLDISIGLKRMSRVKVFAC